MHDLRLTIILKGLNDMVFSNFGNFKFGYVNEYHVYSLSPFNAVAC